VLTQDYVTYVKILTWFLDNPSPLCPFGVHRMALAGKELGKDVGQWFGPSTAAGAIRRLVLAFPEAQLAVSVASDGVVFDSDVYAASNVGNDSRRRHASRFRWGGRAVLVLVGIRLGIDGVNPIYHEGVKVRFILSNKLQTR
jgi:cysteine protease ATG4